MKDATYGAMAEAFLIFAKYDPEATYEITAEHDVIYAGRAPDKYSAEDKKRLEELGWHYDESLECYHYFT